MSWRTDTDAMGKAPGTDSRLLHNASTNWVDSGRFEVRLGNSMKTSKVSTISSLTRNGRDLADYLKPC